jgi:hypothetical protein
VYASSDRKGGTGTGISSLNRLLLCAERRIELPRLVRFESGRDRDRDLAERYDDDRRGRGVAAIIAAMSGLSAPSRAWDSVEVGTETDRDSLVEVDNCGGADIGSGGRSLFMTAVGGRGGRGTPKPGRRQGGCRDLVTIVDIGGADRGSASSSCSTGRSRISMDDIDSCNPAVVRCPPPLRLRESDGVICSSGTCSSSVSVRS